jgi:hypothetical protein
MEISIKFNNSHNDPRKHNWFYVFSLLATILIYTATVGFNVIPTGPNSKSKKIT